MHLHKWYIIPVVVEVYDTLNLQKMIMMKYEITLYKSTVEQLKVHFRMNIR